MRKVSFVNGEFYHVYNRGVDKRTLFLDEKDLDRFMQGMDEFNTSDPIGSIYENSFRKEKTTSPKPLVKFVCYCINPNHFHFLLEQSVEKGIEKFLHRLGTGYVKYFNNRYTRTGSLFQGPFKAIHVSSNEYMLHLSAYINLNNEVHQLGSQASKLVDSRSSWKEYISVYTKGLDFCDKRIILEQFPTKGSYKVFARESLQSILEGREEREDISTLLLE